MKTEYFTHKMNKVVYFTKLNHFLYKPELSGKRNSSLFMCVPKELNEIRLPMGNVLWNCLVLFIYRFLRHCKAKINHVILCRICYKILGIIQKGSLFLLLLRTKCVFISRLLDAHVYSCLGSRSSFGLLFIFWKIHWCASTEHAILLQVFVVKMGNFKNVSIVGYGKRIPTMLPILP